MDKAWACFYSPHKYNFVGSCPVGISIQKKISLGGKEQFGLELLVDLRIELGNQFCHHLSRTTLLA
jgi:hypothetical protein